MGFSINRKQYFLSYSHTGEIFNKKLSTFIKPLSKIVGRFKDKEKNKKYRMQSILPETDFYARIDDYFIVSHKHDILKENSVLISPAKKERLKNLRSFKLEDQHIHVYLNLSCAIKTLNARVFDVNENHPHISGVSKLSGSKDRTLYYMISDALEVDTNIPEYAGKSVEELKNLLRAKVFNTSAGFRYAEKMKEQNSLDSDDYQEFLEELENTKPEDFVNSSLVEKPVELAKLITPVEPLSPVLKGLPLKLEEVDSEIIKSVSTSSTSKARNGEIVSPEATCEYNNIDEKERKDNVDLTFYSRSLLKERGGTMVLDTWQNEKISKELKIVERLLLAYVSEENLENLENFFSLKCKEEIGAEIKIIKTKLEFDNIKQSKLISGILVNQFWTWDTFDQKYILDSLFDKEKVPLHLKKILLIVGTPPDVDVTFLDELKKKYTTTCISINNPIIINTTTIYNYNTYNYNLNFKTVIENIKKSCQNFTLLYIQIF